MAQHIGRRLIGLAVILLVARESYCIRHVSYNQQSHILQQTSTVGNSGTTYALNSTELFGMHLNGRFTISDGIRNEVLKRFKNAYSDSKCDLATDSGHCNSPSRQVVELRKGLYNYGAERQKRQETSLSSITGSGCGHKFDCYISADAKRKIVQKCWLYDLYADIHDDQSSSSSPQGQTTGPISLHKISVAGAALRWADISDYMSKVGDKLVPTKPGSSQNFDYSTIYSEIECEMKAINIDTRSNAPNQIFDQHADLIQKLHNHFYQLKNAVKKKDGKNYDCYSELLQLMKHLTDLVEKDEQNWEDIMKVEVFKKMVIKLDDTANAVHKYYTNDTPEKKGIYFCHHQILVEYTSFVNERKVAIDKLKVDFGVTSNKGVLNNMTSTTMIFKSLTKLLFKTLLMSTKDRYADINKEIEKVSVTLKLLHNK
ncbi:uncharacterized protein LOC134821399 [Bolinopsis microptera]|uniref:uncharacterized protein LOC134821399 n=1 Tax=Bolinopsis microptera TaxID=2820187 RepID=UPI00307AA6CB